MARPTIWEAPVGGTTEWYTPPSLFEAIGLRFDLDPASPGAEAVPWVPADRHYTVVDNGLWLPWEGRVWLNPPYGPEAVAFVDRMIAHGHGLALLFSRTETAWWQAAARSAGAVCFLRERIYFIRGEDGFQGRAAAGSTLFAWGDDCVAAVRHADLGWIP